MNTCTHITQEQKEAWDKVPKEKGLINFCGEIAFEYMCQHLKRLLLYNLGADPLTILLIGSEDWRFRLFKKMIAIGALEEGEIEPWFFWFNEREGPDGEEVSCGLMSEDDTERFCDFIRHSKMNDYWRVGAVVVLNEGEEIKHIDRLLKVPVWRGSTIEKHIEVPVFNYSDTDGWADVEKATKITTRSGLTRTIEVKWGNEIMPEAIEFLVPDFVPLRQATAFSGEMDTRKSTLALDIAAKGSLFGKWFTGTENQHKPFITLVAADEDTYNTTVLPRFIAAGGNPDCLGCLNLEVKCEQQTEDGLQVYSTPLSFDEHLQLLADTIRDINGTREWKVGLLINDPIISFFGNKNYNSSQDSRDIMRGLKALCEELQITIINICHFNKTQGLTAKQKTAGSKALIEAHRQAWAFDLMEEDKSTTLIAPIKHNLLKDGRSYKITTDSKEIEWEVGGGYCQKAEVGVIRFVGYSKMTADERIEERESKDRGSRKEIKKAILDALEGGPKPAGHIYNELRDMGSISSLRRAAQSLEEEGKLLRSGSNNRNMAWQLATEAEQVPIFQTNGQR